MAKRYGLRFQIFKTEPEAKGFCSEVNASNAYLRSHKPAHYTPCSSQDGQETGFVAWYYAK